MIADVASRELLRPCVNYQDRDPSRYSIKCVIPSASIPRLKTYAPVSGVWLSTIRVHANLRPSKLIIECLEPTVAGGT